VRGGLWFLCIKNLIVNGNICETQQKKTCLSECERRVFSGVHLQLVNILALPLSTVPLPNGVIDEKA
jgi:hypothetical protein